MLKEAHELLSDIKTNQLFLQELLLKEAHELLSNIKTNQLFLQELLLKEAHELLSNSLSAPVLQLPRPSRSTEESNLRHIVIGEIGATRPYFKGGGIFLLV